MNAPSSTINLFQIFSWFKVVRDNDQGAFELSCIFNKASNLEVVL